MADMKTFESILQYNCRMDFFIMNKIQYISLSKVTFIKYLTGGVYMSFFKAVTPMEDYSLQIEMATGNTILLDLSSKLETTRFYPLKDPDVFKSVAIDGDFLVFGNKVKIGATEVMNMVMLTNE